MLDVPDDFKSWELDFSGWAKVIHTKYSKHEPYTVAHTFDCVCSRMNNS